MEVEENSIKHIDKLIDNWLWARNGLASLKDIGKFLNARNAYQRRMNHLKTVFLSGHDVLGKASELSCVAILLLFTVIAILTAWNKFMKISRRKDSTRVKSHRDAMCLPVWNV